MQEAKETSSPIKAVVKKGVPLVFARAIETAGLTVTAYYLSRLDETHLAASGLITPVHLFIINAPKFSVYSVNYIAAQSINNREALKHVIRMSLATTLVFSIPSTIASLKIEEILNLLGQDENLTSIVGEYYAGYAFGVPGAYVLSCLQQYAIGTNQNALVLLSSLVQTGSLVGLGYFLGFGAGSFPAIGTKGIACASAASNWLACQFLFLSLICNDLPFSLKKFTKKDLEIFSKLLRKGLPIGGFGLTELAGLFALSLFIGGSDDAAHALIAYEIITQVGAPFTTTLFAFSSATGSLVGQKIKDFPQEARKIGNISLFLSQAIPLLYLSTMMCFYKPISSLFIDTTLPENEDILNYVFIFSFLYSLNLSPDALRNIAFGSLGGLLDTLYPMMVGLLSMGLVNIPGMALLSHFFGSTGAFIGRSIGISCHAGLMIPRWCSKINEHLRNSDVISDMNNSGNDFQYMEVGSSASQNYKDSFFSNSKKTSQSKLIQTQHSNEEENENSCCSSCTIL